MHGRNLCLVFSILLSLQARDTSLSGNGKCTRFHFPTLNGTHNLTVVENTTVSLPFRLLTVGCDNSSVFRIDVQQGKTAWCSLPHRNGTCQLNAGTSNHCSCDGNDSYVFTSNFTRPAPARLKWSARGSDTEEAEIDFYILYPPRVTSLTIEDRDTPASQGNNVSVKCDWDPGYPPVHNASLILPKRPMIQISNNTTYTLDNVTCVDTGKMTCEVPGADVNLTATLLVQCPPEFVNNTSNIMVVSGMATNLTFSFRAHTNETEECWITKNVSSAPNCSDIRPVDSASQLNCSSSLTVSGIPPDLVLTVRLDNVTKLDEGQWRINLINSFGSGCLDFYLNVTDSSVVWPQGVFISIPVVATFVTVVLVIMIICHNQRSGKCGRQEVCDMVPNSVYETAEDFLRRSANSPYSDVADCVLTTLPVVDIMTAAPCCEEDPSYENTVGQQQLTDNINDTGNTSSSDDDGLPVPLGGSGAPEAS